MTKHFLLTLVAFLILPVAGSGQGSVIDGGRLQHFGGAYEDFGRAIAIDGEGNIYVAGEFDGTTSFGGITLKSAGSRDIFIVKCRPDGSVAWAKRLGDKQRQHGYGIAADSAGNLYVTGAFDGSIDFGGRTLTTAGGIDMFIAKYRTDGTFDWATRVGGNQNDEGLAITVDRTGNVYATGLFRGSVDFGGDTLTSGGEDDIIIVKHDPDGVMAWIRQAGGSGRDIGRSVEVDNEGNIYVTGGFESIIDFGSGPLVSAGETDLFAAMYRPDGTLGWARRAGGEGYDSGNDIAVDTAGNTYICGEFFESARFDTVEVTGIGERDLFIARFNREGNVEWVSTGGEAIRDIAVSIAVDAGGTIYSSGYFVGTADFGDRRLTSRGSGTDVCIVAYEPDGRVRRAIRAGGLFDDAGTALVLDSRGDLHATGFFHLTADFAEDSLISAGYQDAFVWKIDREVLQKSVSGVISSSSASATAADLLSIYPNPLQAGTNAIVEIEMERAGQARVVVVDLLGKPIAVVFDGELPAGLKQVKLDAAPIVAGTFYLIVETPFGRSMRQLAIVK